MFRREMNEKVVGETTESLWDEVSDVFSTFSNNLLLSFLKYCLSLILRVFSLKKIRIINYFCLLQSS